MFYVSSMTIVLTSIQITVYVEVGYVHRVSRTIVALNERRQALIEEALH